MKTPKDTWRVLPPTAASAVAAEMLNSREAHLRIATLERELAELREAAREARRRAYIAGYDFGYDHADVTEHNGYHRIDPCIEWPSHEVVQRAADAYAAATETVALLPAASEPAKEPA